MTEQEKPAQAKSKGREAYDTVADTVGLVPSLRWKDNLIQAAIVGVITILAALVGLVWNGVQGLLLGVLVGLVASLLLSGLILMVVGWVRTAKKVKG